MIKLNKVNKWFNKYKKNKIHVINNTSLKLPDSGLIALLGPSGSGKTTLLNTIGGLDKVDSGVITINGERISTSNQYKVDKIRNLNIGYIFQDYKLVNELSVYENISLVLKMIGIKDKKEIDKRVLYVLEKVGMLRTEYNGAQDFDFVLRYSEVTNNIYHIPKILYHWRMIPGSTSPTGCRSHRRPVRRKNRPTARLRKEANNECQRIF